MNIPHKHIIPLIVFVAVSTYSTVSAQVEEYLPLTQTELSKRFPLRYHGMIEKKERIIQITGEQSLSTIQISMTEDVIVIGQDERHMPWRFHIQGYGNLYLYDMYTADLDLNAYEDIILLVSTGGSGLAPTTHLITLLFDTSGRPIPFGADGYWKHDEQSITGLVDLDNRWKRGYSLNHRNPAWQCMGNVVPINVARNCCGHSRHHQSKKNKHMSDIPRSRPPTNGIYRGHTIFL